MGALRVLGSALRAVWGHVTAALFACILGLALSLPVLILLSLAAHRVSLGLLPLGVVLLLGVLPNPVMAGVQAAGQLLVEGEVPTLREEWSAIGGHWRPALLGWLAGAAISGVIGANLAFYGQMGAGRGPAHILAGPLELVWLLALIVWLCMHLYVYPLLLRQERPALLLAYRNALVLSVTHPLFTVTTSALWLLWLLLGAFTGVGYVGGLTVAAGMQHAALSRAIARFDLAGAPAR